MRETAASNVIFKREEKARAEAVRASWCRRPGGHASLDDGYRIEE